MSASGVNSGRDPPGPAAADGRASGEGVLAPAIRRAGARLRRWLAGDQERWPLWLPVAIGIGAIVYFEGAAEPSSWWGPAVLAASGAGSFLWHRLQAEPRWLGAVLVALTAAALGFAVAQGHVAGLAGPRIEKRIGPTAVSGQVLDTEAMARGHRLLLQTLTIEGIEAAATPERVRIRVSGLPKAPMPGERITLKAVLMPPPAPAMPGAFDAQWLAFFQRIGGVGYAVGPILARREPGPGLSWSIRLSAFRQVLQERIEAAFGDDEAGRTRGAIAGALLTGKRGAIPEDAIQAMRDSGLAHLLAISGMNIGLAAGFVFFVLRAALALIAPLALRVDIKKVAALAAVAVAFAYLLISGAAVPAQRSFAMLAIALLAVLVGRIAISMRTLAWAAIVILLLAPDSVLGPSFQLSFSAVVVLIAAYEAAQARREARLRASDGASEADRRWFGRIGLYVGILMLTSLLATLATTPFSVYHFNRFPTYGVVANLLAVPISSFWVMPWLLVAVLLLPFGLEGWALTPLGWGLDAIVAVARMVAGWPGAVWPVPAMPPAGLAAVALGGIWTCLWRQNWRWLGLLGVAAGLASIGLVRPPDLLLAGDGRLAAIRAADGGYWLSSERAAVFVRDAWLRRSGGRIAGRWPKSGETPDGRLACGAQRCSVRVAGAAVVLPRGEGALQPDCAGAAIVASLNPVRGDDRRACRRAALIIDRFDLWRQGGHALWIEPDRVRVETVNGERGRRPWVVMPRRAGEARDGEVPLNSGARGPRDGPES